MINLLELSGIKTRLIDLLTPFLSFLGVPSEVVPLIAIKPFSGSGSLALLDEIFTSNGADSYVGRVASVIFGSSETTFYIAAVYFSDCKTKKLFAPIVISLVATLISAAVACLLCRIM
jgi:spore maturation protein B